MRMRSVAGLLVFACTLLAASPVWASAESSYTVWTAGPPNDTSLPTPHKDFQLTTSKCGVCHAVHKGTAGGQVLLRTTIANACVYCHIQTDIGVDRIYNGITANYTVENDRGHQAPAVECVDCHAVHGADTFNGQWTTKILKVFDIQQSVIDELGSGDASVVINATGDYGSNPLFGDQWYATGIQDTAFCSQCHPYYASASETTVTDEVVQSDGSFVTTSFTTHPMKQIGGEAGNPWFEGFVAKGSTLPTAGAENIIAQLTTRGCKWNCHAYSWGASGPGIVPNSYPHYMVDTTRFLIAAEYASAPEQSVSDPSEDGVCIRCHIWDNGSGLVGVGITY